MEKYVIGMDGGGTKTIVLLADMHANIKQRFTAGALNMNGQRKQEVIETFIEIFDKIASMGYQKEDCQGICIGTAGISNPIAKRFVEKSAAAFSFSNKIMVIGDHETALTGALGSGDGIIVIAGTGSICFGVDADGNSYRSGGYGHLIDDVGSGYAIARDILIRIIQAHDRRGPNTILKQQVFETLRIETIDELIAYVYDTKRSKKEIAALSKLLTEAVINGDDVAQEIVKKSAIDLAELASPVIEQVGRSSALTVGGGILMNNVEIYDAFREELYCRYPDLEIVRPKKEAAYGAVEIILDCLMEGVSSVSST